MPELLYSGISGYSGSLAKISVATSSALTPPGNLDTTL